MAQEIVAPVLGDHTGVHPLRRIGVLIRRLDVLPSSPALSPVTYSPQLVTFVTSTGILAIVLTGVTVRSPSDWATLGLGAAITFLMAVYAIRAVAPSPISWTPTPFLHLGLSVILGPAGAAAAAVAEPLGVSVRNHNGWFRTTFNISNQFLANLAAWAIFTGVREVAGPGWGAALIAGVAAAIGQYVVNTGFVSLVIHLATPSVRVTSVLRSRLEILPYCIGYGFAAFAFLIVHQQAGAIGFLALLAPVILLHGFLIVFARRINAYEAQRAEYQKEREGLLQKAVEASEAERRRIARDLHDGVVQDLAGMAFALSATSSRLKGADALANGQSELLETLDQSAADTRAAMKDLRTLIIDLSPPTLRREGLHAALLEVLRDIQRKGTTTKLDLPPNLRLRDDRAALIFRVAQEVLRNVAAHAHAKNVVVELKKDGGMAVLRIEDDGRGFTERDVARRRAQGHLGTTAIAELAEEAQGTLVVDSEPGRGTRVTLSVPAE